MKKSVKTLSVKRITIVGVLGGISILLGMTPLGFIPIGPTRATIMHIPVIIGAIIEGPLVGGLIGLIFGLFSIFQAVTNPTPISPIFLNPIVSVLPRILIGVVTYYVYRFIKDLSYRRAFWILNIIWISMISYLAYGIYTNIVDFQNIWIIVMNIIFIALTVSIGIYINKRLKNKAIDIILSTVMGTLTNTVGVLFSIYVLYAEEYVETLGLSKDLAGKTILGIGVTNGIPEVIIAIIVVTNVVIALKGRSE